MLCSCPVPLLDIPFKECQPQPDPSFDLDVKVLVYPVLQPLTAWGTDRKFDQLLENMDMFIDELAAHHDPDQCLASLVYGQIRAGYTHHLKLEWKQNPERIHTYQIRTAEVLIERDLPGDYGRRTFGQERILLTLEPKF